METAAILKQANFLVLWTASSLSALADSAYFIALAWTVVQATHSELALGTTLLLASIPRLALMLFGGVAADRVNPKVLLLMSLLARSAILAALGLLFMSGMRERAMDFYVVALLFGTVDAFYWPTQGSLVPRVVEPRQISVANSLIQTVQQGSFVIGPLLAGILLRLPAHQTFLVVAAIYLLGSVAVVFLKASLSADREARAASPWRDLTQGLRYVASVRIMALIMGIATIFGLVLMGPLNVGLPLFVNQHHWSGAIYGYFEAGFGVGAVLGAVGNAVLKGLRGHYRWIGGLGTITGMALAGVSLVSAWGPGAALMALAGASMTLVSIPIMTYMQVIADQELMGRVMSLMTMTSIGLTPVSYALCSWFLSAKLLLPKELLMGAGILIALLFLSLFVIPDFYHMEDNPRWQAAAPESAKG